MIRRAATTILVAATVLAALYVPAAAGNRPRQATHAPPLPPGAWTRISLLPGVNAVYVDTAGIVRDGKGGVSLSVLTVSLNYPHGLTVVLKDGRARALEKPDINGRVARIEVSCGLRLIRSRRVIRTWPSPPRGPGGDYPARVGYLSPHAMLAPYIDAACANRPAEAGGKPGLPTADAAWREAVGALAPNAPAPPPVPMPMPPQPEGQPLPSWVTAADARYVAVPGGSDVPGAVLFLDVANAGHPASGGVLARTLVVLGPDFMGDETYADPIVLIRLAVYDCERRTVTVRGQSGFTRHAHYDDGHSGYGPRGAEESPALAAELDAVCGMIRGHPPAGEGHMGWRAAFGAARAGWPAGSPDMPPYVEPPRRPPLPPQIAPPSPPPRLPGPAAAPQPPILYSPPWSRMASWNEIRALYPTAALAERVEGSVVLLCTVAAGGLLTDCEVTAEGPKGLGFGEAAQMLSGLYQVKPYTDDGEPTEGRRVQLEILIDPPR